MAIINIDRKYDSDIKTLKDRLERLEQMKHGTEATLKLSLEPGNPPQTKKSENLEKIERYSDQISKLKQNITEIENKSSSDSEATIKLKLEHTDPTAGETLTKKKAKRTKRTTSNGRAKKTTAKKTTKTTKKKTTKKKAVKKTAKKTASRTSTRSTTISKVRIEKLEKSITFLNTGIENLIKLFTKVNQELFDNDDDKVITKLDKIISQNTDALAQNEKIASAILKIAGIGDEHKDKSKAWHKDQSDTSERRFPADSSTADDSRQMKIDKLQLAPVKKRHKDVEKEDKEIDYKDDMWHENIRNAFGMSRDEQLKEFNDEYDKNDDKRDEIEEMPRLFKNDIPKPNLPYKWREEIDDETMPIRMNTAPKPPFSDEENLSDKQKRSRDRYEQ